MKRLALFTIFFAITLSGCYEVTHKPSADLNTQPVTNNPLIVPSHGSGVPGMSR